MTCRGPAAVDRHHVGHRIKSGRSGQDRRPIEDRDVAAGDRVERRADRPAREHDRDARHRVQSRSVGSDGPAWPRTSGPSSAAWPCRGAVGPPGSGRTSSPDERATGTRSTSRPSPASSTRRAGRWRAASATSASRACPRVRVGRRVELTVEAADEAAARAVVERLAGELLAQPADRGVRHRVARRRVVERRRSGGGARR